MPCLARRCLREFYPTAGDVLSADLKGLGEALLIHLDSYEGRVKQHGRFYQGHLRDTLDNRNSGLGQMLLVPEYGPMQTQVTERVMEAWYWLERQGLLIPDASCHGWHLISTEGKRLLEKLTATSRGASVDPNSMVDYRSITIAGPDETFLLIEHRGDRYQWRLRNDSLSDYKTLQLEIMDARSFSAKHSAFRDPMGFRFRWPLVEELPSGHLSRGEVFLRFEGDKVGFGDTTGTHLLPWPNGDPSTTRRWLLSMRVVGLSREWPIELDLQWVLGTRMLELMDHAPPSPSALPDSNIHSLSNPFTFFKEARPLGDNPYPAESSVWHAFEEETHVAKNKLDSLWSDYLGCYAPAESHAEILALILEARLKRLDIIAECMRRVFVADPETGQHYEDWVADFMRAEEQDVQDLVQKEVPHYSRYFDHEKFMHSLLLRQQSYKKTNDSNVIGLIRQRQATREANHAMPSQPRKRNTDQGLQLLRVRIQKLRAEGLSHLDICRTLGDAPRPPRATWRDLTWPAAYRQYPAAVTKWLSDACR